MTKDSHQVKAIAESSTPIEIRDLWQTPRYLFDYFDREFDFGLDLCASDDNHLVSNYLTEKEDAFDPRHNWNKLSGGKSVWCNPPYSRGHIPALMDEAKIQAHKNGVTTVFLVPADTSASWFPFESAKEIRFISGSRVSFVRADTKKMITGNTKGSAVCIFSPKPINKPATLSHINRKSM